MGLVAELCPVRTVRRQPSASQEGSPPGGTELAITSTLDLQPPQLCEKSILLFKPQAVLVCYIR